MVRKATVKKTPKARKESETQISKSIRDALTALGIWNIRIQSGILKIGNRFVHLAPKGTPDILILDYDGTGSYDGSGKAGFLEVKKDDGKLSPEQIKFQEKADSHNVKLGTVHSVQEAIDTIKSWIEKDKNNENDKTV